MKVNGINWEKPWRRHRVAVIIFVLLCALSGVADTGVITSESHPFQGVRHVHIQQTAPEPLAAHLVFIALDAPGIKFKTTAANGEENARDTWCETTRDFVDRVGAQIGVNANYFIHDLETHTALLGLAVSEGVVVSTWDKGDVRFALNISKDNKATFVERPEDGAGTADTVPPMELYNAVSGRPMLLRDGKILVEAGGERHPRTGIGLAADNMLVLLVVDGRQPAHSVGMTFHEMAAFLLEHGVKDALALDGGGSSTLVFADTEPRIVNVPMPAPLPLGVTLGQPGIERLTGNNLAVFALPQEDDAATGDAANR